MNDHHFIAKSGCFYRLLSSTFTRQLNMHRKASGKCGLGNIFQTWAINAYTEFLWPCKLMSGKELMENLWCNADRLKHTLSRTISHAGPSASSRICGSHGSRRNSCGTKDATSFCGIFLRSSVLVLFWHLAPVLFVQWPHGQRYLIFNLFSSTKSPIITLITISMPLSVSVTLQSDSILIILISHFTYI